MYMRRQVLQNLNKTLENSREKERDEDENTSDQVT